MKGKRRYKLKTISAMYPSVSGDASELTELKVWLKTLRAGGITVRANGSHESYGGLVHHKVVDSAAAGDDLFATAKSVAARALSKVYVEWNEEMWMARQSQMARKDYAAHLRSEFVNDNDHLGGALAWLNDKDPFKGVISSSPEPVGKFFDVCSDLVDLDRMWTDNFQQLFDKKLNEKVCDRIEGGRNEWLETRIEGTSSEHSGLLSGVETPLGSALSFKNVGVPMEKILDVALKPVFDGYEERAVYIASPDTFYFDIGRPSFYPVLMGRRTDGSVEVSIFDAVNET